MLYQVTLIDYHGCIQTVHGSLLDILFTHTNLAKGKEQTSLCCGLALLLFT